MTHARQQHGYALLLALMLVLIVGVTMAGMARRSAHAAIQVDTDYQSLQRRWATLTLREALLPRAAIILDDAERGSPRPIDEDEFVDPSTVYVNAPLAQYRVTCRLVDHDYDLILTDEQAKLNVNGLLRRQTSGVAGAQVARVIRAAADRSESRPEVRLRPRVASIGSGDATISDNARTSIQTFGQVFEVVDPAALVGRNEREGWARAITCWGGERVNIRRAPDAVLQHVCQETLGPITTRRLLETRNKHPFEKLDTLFARMDQIDRDQRSVLAQVLTDRSKCFGLWIVARDQEGRHRSRHTLSIGIGRRPTIEGDEPIDPRRLIITQRFDFDW